MVSRSGLDCVFPFPRIGAMMCVCVCVCMCWCVLLCVGGGWWCVCVVLCVCVCVCVCVLQEEGRSRVAAAAELPGLGEGGERAQVVGLVEAHQLALHLLGGADGAGAPLAGAG